MTITFVSSAKTNGELVAQAATLYAPDPARETWRVLDPTPGRGGMWRCWRPANLIESRHDFTEPLPFEWGSFDLILFDPPYVAKGGKATKASVADHDDRYGREARTDGRKTALTPAEVERLMTRGMIQCAVLVRRRGMLWVKSADYVTSGRIVWGNHLVRTFGRQLGLEQVDELYLPSNSPQPKCNLDGTPRRQVHAHRGGSLLTIWRRP